MPACFFFCGLEARTPSGGASCLLFFTFAGWKPALPGGESPLPAVRLTTETGFELIPCMAPTEDTINAALLTRITVRPDVFGGKPIVRDMRISVELILSLLAQGVTPAAILEDYPALEADDIRACIAYAHAVIAKDTLSAVSVAES